MYKYCMCTGTESCTHIVCELVLIRVQVLYVYWHRTPYKYCMCIDTGSYTSTVYVLVLRTEYHMCPGTVPCTGNACVLVLNPVQLTALYVLVLSPV